jgi:hypothetical protein
MIEERIPDPSHTFHLHFRRPRPIVLRILLNYIESVSVQTIWSSAFPIFTMSPNTKVCYIESPASTSYVCMYIRGQSFLKLLPLARFHLTTALSFEEVLSLLCDEVLAYDIFLLCGLKSNSLKPEPHRFIFQWRGETVPVLVHRTFSSTRKEDPEVKDCSVFRLRGRITNHKSQPPFRPLELEVEYMWATLSIQPWASNILFPPHPPNWSLMVWSEGFPLKRESRI